MPGGEVRATEGRMPGRLAREPRGTNGFGYDPILVVEGDTRHSAELSPEEKNAVSHRGKAFRAMAPHLRELFA
jgi:XTP/dITP diphosphohydrolase